MPVTPLAPDRLYRKADLSTLPFETTAALDHTDRLAGQDRARDALRLGMRIGAPGFNVFAVGSSGARIQRSIKSLLEVAAAERPPAPDWVYVNNFAAPHRPTAIQLPRGTAPVFADAMHHLIDDLKAALPGVFESESYQSRRGAIDEAIRTKGDAAFSALRDKALQRNIVIVRTPTGFGMAPAKDGDVIPPETFNAWPAEQRKAVEDAIHDLEHDLEQTLRAIPRLDKERRDAIRALDQETARFAVGQSIDDAREKLAHLPMVLGHLDAVRDDLVQNVHLFIAPQQQSAGEDANKLTLITETVRDLLVEAAYYADEAKRATIVRADIDLAIEAQIRRASRIRELSAEMILRDIALIDTSGTKVGQINGLSVMSLGGFSFGRPTRITCRVHPGAGRILDIEREVKTGGPSHSKGVLILSGYLAGRYSLDTPISISASLVFEQSYGGVDGDSASSTELYALLSALAEATLRQDLAVTGSVNQHGEVQAIGGVNDKIEGYFEICKARGLTGQQGVMIPASNVQHLMLRAEVVEACAAGRFAIYPIATIAEGIELLTGLPSAEIDAAVEARLKAFARARRSHDEDEKALR